jgi:hypothetical protein
MDWPADADGGRAIIDLKRDGIAMLSPLAPEASIASMVAYFLKQDVVGPDGTSGPLDRLPANTPAAAYGMGTILDCPDLMGVLNAPPILRLASEYLGCKPTLSSVGVRWSFPSDRPTDTQRFHRDVDDWRFLKLFIYLTDVDETSGPHAYVRTSHKRGFGLQAKAYSMDHVESRYGADKLATVTGPRGTTFMADTQGVHRGSAPIDRPRLILQAQYSLLPIYAFLYEPLERADFTSDAYVNRLVVRPSAAAAG